ncbi:MAG: FkbM family methyltransferase [Nitrospirota bacterium]|nr:FkbM family methyltransferase [Nitrospirota bacterium]
MFSTSKKFIKASLSTSSRWLRKTRPGAYAFEIIVNTAMQATQTLTHQKTTLTFAVPNNLNRFRVESFSTKEPETLEWIDAIPRGAVVWDIGANVGLYSCYSAKARDCQVFAFEPSVFNLELLARNICLNGLTGKIVIVPLPLFDSMAINTLNMTTTDWGGALSTFGQDYGWDGQRMQPVFKFQTIGVSGSDAVQLLRVPQPNFIKIDVDGIEHLVLRGAMAVLKKVDGVLIEVNDSFHEQAEQCQKLLLEAGLVLKEKRHSALFDSAESFGGGKVWNQIWVRAQTPGT